MLIAIVIAKEIFDTKIPRIHRIPNDFMSNWNSTIWAIWLGDWLSSTFGIWDSILGIEGSWTSKFEGPQCPLCPQCPLHSAHSGPSNFEVQLPLMPKIKSQIPKVELNQSPNQIAQIVLFQFDIKPLGILWILWTFVSKIFLAMTMAMSIYRTLCVLVIDRLPYLSLQNIQFSS